MNKEERDILSKYIQEIDKVITDIVTQRLHHKDDKEWIGKNQMSIDKLLVDIQQDLSYILQKDIDVSIEEIEELAREYAVGCKLDWTDFRFSEHQQIKINAFEEGAKTILRKDGRIH